MLRGALHVPGKTLKQAEAWYHNAMHRLGVQGHGLRYAFARERVEAYLQSGIPMAEALARTSMDLGHGDGRGRRWFICGGEAMTTKDKAGA